MTIKFWYKGYKGIVEKKEIFQRWINDIVVSCK